MKINIAITIFCYLCLPSFLCAQLEESIWFFGGLDNGTRAGIRFEGPNLQATPYNDVRHPLNLQENNIIITNPTTADVIFYSDGSTVVDATHQPMPNGENLSGMTSTMYGTAVVYDPTVCNRYYLFYTQQFDNTNPPRRLYYSVVDLDLAGNGTNTDPLGDIDIASKDIEITPTGVDCVEGIYAISKGDNTRESWLLFADRVENTMYIYDVNEFGISLHSSTSFESIFPSFPNDNLFGVRFLFRREVGNQGKLIIAPSRSVNQNDLPLGVVNFDASSGNFDANAVNVFTLDSSWAYGITFSPDGSKIYYSDYFDKTLKQYDLDTGNTYLVATANHNGRSGGLGLGPDGRIYWANVYVNQSTNTNPFLSTVNAPNEAGASCDFELNSWTIGGGILPRLIGAFPTFGSFPAPPIVEAISSASCGEANGSATVVQGSGVEPLTYAWDNGENTVTASLLSPGVHTVLIIDALGCEYQATVTIEEGIEAFELENPVLNITNVSDCTGVDDGSISLSANNLDASSLYYVSYMQDGESVGPITLITDMNGVLVIPDLTAGFYSDLIITDVTGCSAGFAGDWTITAPNQPDIPTIELLGIPCIGQTLRLITTDIPNATYYWTGPNGFVSNQLELTFDASPVVEGIYTLTVVVDECESLAASFELILDETTLDLGPDVELCDDLASLEVADNFESVIWSTGEQTNTLIVGESGTYWVNATSADGCLLSDTIVVEILSEPIFDLPASFETSQEVVLTIVPNIISIGTFTYNWSPAELLSCTTCPNPQFIGNQSGMIYVEVGNSESCSTIDSTFINYSISEDIYIPNAFSPNDDGFNDLFEIYSKEENTKIVTLKIFDRWGGLVHEANNMSIGDSRYAWNGALRGKKMPTGIYIYYVEVILSDQISKVLKGDVLLMR